MHKIKLHPSYSTNMRKYSNVNSEIFVLRFFFSEITLEMYENFSPFKEAMMLKGS